LEKFTGNKHGDIDLDAKYSVLLSQNPVEIKVSHFAIPAGF
jgi:hypothetical protein